MQVSTNMVGAALGWSIIAMVMFLVFSVIRVLLNVVQYIRGQISMKIQQRVDAAHRSASKIETLVIDCVTESLQEDRGLTRELLEWIEDPTTKQDNFLKDNHMQRLKEMWTEYVIRNPKQFHALCEESNFLRQLAKTLDEEMDEKRLKAVWEIQGVADALRDSIFSIKADVH